MSELPTIQLFDDTYYVDRRLRQLRNAHDPHDCIDFDEFETSLKLAVISIRHSGGIEQHKALYERLLRQARDYDAAVGNAPKATLTGVPTEPLAQTPASTNKRKRRLSLV